MYRSKEIRWFSEKPLEHIETWFRNQGLTFENTDPRTDFYLALPGKDDLNVKLREGNVEIKHRLGRPVPGALTEHVLGGFENWVKWSFKLAEDDSLSKAIIDDTNVDWVKVHKRRVGVKLARDANDQAQLLSIFEQVLYGCQIEYTLIRVNNRKWFTFGLEWFGGRILEPGQDLLDAILEDTVLGPEDSMGYSGFLNTVL